MKEFWFTPKNFGSGLDANKVTEIANKNYQYLKMHKKDISFSIPLSGPTLESSNLLLNDLEKKFSIKFIKNKKSRLHINLFSGSTENLDASSIGAKEMPFFIRSSYR